MITTRWMGGPADVQQIIAFYEGRQVTYAAATQAAEKHRKTPGWCCLVAVEDDTVVGFLSWLERPYYLDVQGFGVHSDHRRRGIGRLLFDQIRGRLSDRRPHLLCEVPDDLLPAHLFLKAIGLPCLGVKRSSVADETDRYVFGLDNLTTAAMAG